MVQISVGGGQFGEIPLLEGSAVQFAETAELFPHRAAGRWAFALPSIPDGQVDELLETGEFIGLTIKGIYADFDGTFFMPYDITSSMAPS